MAIELELYRDIRHLFNDGRSQRQIARMLGCSRWTVRKYQTSRHKCFPTSYFLLAVAGFCPFGSPPNSE